MEAIIGMYKSIVSRISREKDPIITALITSQAESHSLGAVQEYLPV